MQSGNENMLINTLQIDLLLNLGTAKKNDYNTNSHKFVSLFGATELIA